MKQATIQDVANRAGVFKTTVSHVVNASRYVEEEPRKKVLDAIRELKYRPSAAVRSLTTRRTITIGIVISDSSNPFFGELLLSIEEVLRPRNYALIICNTNETFEYEALYLDLLLNQRVDGIIAAATSQPWMELSKSEIQQTPVVFVDRAFENFHGYYVGVDNRAGAYTGTQHLIQYVFQKIGILSGLERLSTTRDRLEGYRQALFDARISANDGWNFPLQLSVEGGRQAMRKLLSLQDRPDAILISNNLLALGALLEIRESDQSWTKYLGIACFDDHPWAAVSNPPLTVIKQPTKQIGQLAAEMILALINEQPLPEKRVILDCELIVRESCRSKNHSHRN